DYPFRYQVQSALSYVTGSHSLKGGVQWHWGSHKWSRDANADLDQRYRNGVPDSVIVYNTPTESRQRLNADLGTFLQDSWTLKQLTVNGGIRFEYFNSSIEAVNLPPGRFINARQFPRIPDIPSWFNVTPRLGVAYDVAGKGTTAVKLGVNKYLRQYTTGFAALYDPSTQQTDVRDWRDLN